MYVPCMELVPRLGAAGRLLVMMQLEIMLVLLLVLSLHGLLLCVHVQPRGVPVFDHLPPQEFSQTQLAQCLQNVKRKKH